MKVRGGELARVERQRNRAIKMLLGDYITYGEPRTESIRRISDALEISEEDIREILRQKD